MAQRYVRVKPPTPSDAPLPEEHWLPCEDAAQRVSRTIPLRLSHVCSGRVVGETQLLSAFTHVALCDLRLFSTFISTKSR